jgi:multicomponent Na+:H+ antiporter subunit C
MALVEFFTVSNLALALFFLGLYGAMTQRNIMKTIMSVGIMDMGAIIFIMLSNKPDDAGHQSWGTRRNKWPTRYPRP